MSRFKNLINLYTLKSKKKLEKKYIMYRKI